MTTAARFRRWIRRAGWMLAIGLAACHASDEGEPGTNACTLAASGTGNRVAAAACAAITAFVRHDFTVDYDYALADITARRFGVEALDTQFDNYLALLASAPTRDRRIFARLGDAAAAVDPLELAALVGIDGITGPALHCDKVPLPADFAARMREQNAVGGWGATHVVLALIFLRDNGCPNPMDAAFVDSALARSASIIDADTSFATDIEIETAAFLSYLGEGRRIPPGFVETVLASQNPDGGFPAWFGTGKSFGHTTGYALWYLHEVLYPGRTTPVVANRPRRRPDALRSRALRSNLAVRSAESPSSAGCLTCSGNDRNLSRGATRGDYG